MQPQKWEELAESLWLTGIFGHWCHLINWKPSRPRKWNWKKWKHHKGMGTEWYILRVFKLPHLSVYARGDVAAWISKRDFEAFSVPLVVHTVGPGVQRTVTGKGSPRHYETSSWLSALPIARTWAALCLGSPSVQGTHREAGVSKQKDRVPVVLASVEHGGGTRLPPKTTLLTSSQCQFTIIAIPSNFLRETINPQVFNIEN